MCCGMPACVQEGKRFSFPNLNTTFCPVSEFPFVIILALRYVDQDGWPLQLIVSGTGCMRLLSAE